MTCKFTEIHRNEYKMDYFLFDLTLNHKIVLINVAYRMF